MTHILFFELTSETVDKYHLKTHPFLESMAIALLEWKFIHKCQNRPWLDGLEVSKYTIESAFDHLLTVVCL
jgi:hypothetical protein